MNNCMGMEGKGVNDWEIYMHWDGFNGKIWGGGVVEVEYPRAKLSKNLRGERAVGGDNTKGRREIREKVQFWSGIYVYLNFQADFG